MEKIEICDIGELIKKNYPPEFIKNLVDKVLYFSLLVKEDYPDYKNWFITKQIPGLYIENRNIIVALLNDRIVGFVSLKKDDNEKKICTFYVIPSFRKNKIGNMLIKKAIEWLEEERPLITIPSDKIGQFLSISKKYNWQVTDIKDGLYRINNPEIIVNGFINDNAKVIDNNYKTLKKLYFYYKFSKIKNDYRNLKNIVYTLIVKII